MLVGSVEVWKNKVFINGRIIDVEKGVAEFAHKETVASVNDLDTGTANFAKNLARRINGLPGNDRGVRRRMDRMYAIHTSHPFPSFRRIRFRRGRIYATPTETDTVPE